MLKGENVILRPVKRKDIKIFLKWFNDPEVIQYLTLFKPITEMEEEKWIEEIAKRNNIIFVIEAIFKKGNKKTIRKPIGNCGFHIIDHLNQNAEIGIAIGEKEYWGKGYGTEAISLLVDYGFNVLNLRRISSGTFSFNQRSIKMHQKLGFVQEGIRRQARFKNGQFHDDVIFGILREEWEKIRNKLLPSTI
jgi:RimJ/RimL family protein N-acetyltransferase